MEDPFENMREQMNRQRDEFFNQQPRDWPNDRNGFINKPRTSFGGFPGGSATLRPRHSAQEDDDFMSGHRSLPRTRRGDPGYTDTMSGDDTSDRSSGSAEGDMGIPIRVIHTGKTRYGAAPQRNTTELPAKAGKGSESPRLERAASEPPNKFKQRLNISANPGISAYTIPENSDTHAQYPDRYPRSSVLPAQERNPIKTSASAPSVPAHQYQEHQNPVPPPRRSPPRMSGDPPAPAPVAGTNVRHIPIFVEGRPEPIFNTNVSQPSQAPAAQSRSAEHDVPFSKPSDYYPPGVQRVRSKDDSVIQEPTTPLGPPPGPIPMGYTPSTLPQPSQDNLSLPTQPPAEPTTPQGPPPGPIPMGYLPRQDQPPEDPPVPPQRQRPAQSQSPQPQEIKSGRKISEPDGPGSRKTSESERREPVVNVIPIKVDHGRSESPRPNQSSRTPSQEPAKVQSSPAPTRKKSPSSNPKIAKLEKIKEDVESLTHKIENFSGKKEDKEYLYLEEMMTRHLISLDGIEPEGDTEIRQIRKESINSINRCLSLLDRKVSDVTNDADDNNQILSQLAEASEKKSDNDNSGST